MKATLDVTLAVLHIGWVAYGIWNAYKQRYDKAAYSIAFALLIKP